MNILETDLIDEDPDAEQELDFNDKDRGSSVWEDYGFDDEDDFGDDDDDYDDSDLEEDDL